MGALPPHASEKLRHGRLGAVRGLIGGVSGRPRGRLVWGHLALGLAASGLPAALEQLGLGRLPLVVEGLVPGEVDVKERGAVGGGLDGRVRLVGRSRGLGASGLSATTQDARLAFSDEGGLPLPRLVEE